MRGVREIEREKEGDECPVIEDTYAHFTRVTKWS